MMDQSFEKQISDKLNQFEVQPSDHLLESIFEKRASRPKRFVGLPYSVFATALLLISLTAISLYVWNQGDNRQSDRSIDPGVNSGLKLPENLANSSIREAEKHPKTGESSLIKTSPAIHHQPIDLKSHKLTGSSKPTNRKFKENETSFQVNNKEGGANADGSNFNSSNFSESYFDLGSQNRPLIETQQHKGNSHLYVYQTVGENELNSYGILFSRVNRISKLPVRYDSETLGMHPYSAEFNRNVLKRKPVFVDVLYSPSINIHSVSGQSQLKQVSNAMSHVSYNTQAGLRITFPVSNRLSIFSGVFYRTQSNVYKGDLYYETNESRTDKIITFINDPVNGVTQLTTYKTVQYTAGNTLQVNHKNTYQLWQVPLGLSYNFGFSHIDFALHGSALINGFKSSNGTIIDLEKYTTSRFESKKAFLGLGAGLSCMAAYKISPKFRIILEPGLQYFGINSIKAGNNIREKAISPQMSVGLRYTVF